jgi:putative transposase
MATKETYMRKRRHTEAQIVAVLKELDAGRPAAELARKNGVHVNTLRLWRSKYGGLDISDLSRLKELENENTQMERIIARQALEIRAMSEVIRKNGWGPQRAKKR